jgi:predicted 3-demethylubiquinone-9 3-methyltransferase (glyoxalase superfamily)
MQKIIPFLWFNGNAEVAVKFYCSIFKDSKILRVARCGEASAKASGQPKGAVMTIAFKLNGQEFTALNGDPEFKFNEAISFVVSCRTQREIDHYWNKLSTGGKQIQCGWLKDTFGVAWQIVRRACRS